MNEARSLWRAWLALLALGAATAVVTWLARGGALPLAGGLAVIAFAAVKAEVILARYLGLSAAPGWLRAFRLALAGLILTLTALYFGPTLL